MVRSVETQTSPYIVNIIVFHGLLTIRIWFDDIVVEKFNYININYLKKRLLSRCIYKFSINATSFVIVIVIKAFY